MRLSNATLSDVPADIATPCYDRAAQAAGIVHFGIGAFHRAHQAVYTDAAMCAGDRDWGIVGVSLRSGAVAQQLNPQNGLYTIGVRSDGMVATKLIGAVQHVLVAARDTRTVMEAVAAPSTRILGFTITENGYCRASDGTLDFGLAGEESVYRYLKDGLALRRARALPGVTLLSCDNLSGNGAQLRALLGEYLAVKDRALGAWVEDHCTFPCSMVDRIVPATTAADLDAAQIALAGLADAAHVVTEPFSQWVIEDRFAMGCPRWEAFGAERVTDVASYETAKLRMLNGAHSALAYLGLRSGHEFVHQAVADPGLRAIVENLMRQEAAPTIAVAGGRNLMAYADALLERFANPALNHRLIQIAMDGSQKIPQRWLDTLAYHQQQGRRCPAILSAIGAWLQHVRGDNGPVDDPLSDVLKAAWDSSGEAQIVQALFRPNAPMASGWTPDDADQALIMAAINRP